jgi:hypothetical protein
MIEDALGHLVADDVELAKTANRSVLGCMNEFSWYCEVAILDAVDIRCLDVARLNYELRRMILGPLRSSHPIELATAQAATR